tara:strand:+ start:756 stop:950 length:195 start_codon:yes stop_codon:yes gene_type:complete
MWSDIKDRLVSSKFWMALAGAVVPLWLGSPDSTEALIASTTVVVSYILGKSYQDSKDASKISAK